MTFLPLVTRELRVRSRASATYWWRCGAALVASAIAAAMMVGGLLVGSGRAGRGMFIALAWLAWLFCLFEGVRSTADCVSREKREGTLGLLFLTDLKGYDVVLGKWMAASVGAFFSLLAALPVLGLALVQGGVTAGEFWRMCLALTNTLFFALAASLLVSVVSREERRAWLGAFVCVGFFTIAVPWVAHLVSAFFRTPLGLASPFTIFRQAFESAYVRAPAVFWNAMLAVNGLGWLCLALASLLLPRLWREKDTQAVPNRLLALLPRRDETTKARASRAELRSLDPILWLALRGRGRGRLLWGVILVASALGLITASALPRQTAVLASLLSFAIVLHLWLTLWVAWEACHAFGNLRQSGLLELLLATPLSADGIVKGQESALRKLFLWPVALLAGTELAITTAAVALELTRGDSGNPAMAVFAGVFTAGGIGLWILDMAAVARVGMWTSLVRAQAGPAWARTVLWVIVAPTLGLLLSTAFCCPLGVGLLLVKDILFIVWATGQLRTRFREVAAQGPPNPVQ